MCGNEAGYWPMKREFNLNHYEIFKYVCKWLEPFNKLIWKLIFEIIWNSDCQNFYSYIFSVRGRLGIIVHYSPLLFQKFCCMVSNSKEIIFTFLNLKQLKAIMNNDCFKAKFEMEFLIFTSKIYHRPNRLLIWRWSYIWAMKQLENI